MATETKLNIIARSISQDLVWGETKTDEILIKGSLYELSQHKNGYSFKRIDPATKKYQHCPDKKVLAQAEVKVKFAYGLFSDYGIGVKLAQGVFAYMNEGWQTRYSQQQLKRMAARAIALLGDLPSPESNRSKEKMLTIANDYPVNLPNSGWIKILQEFIDS